MRFAPTLLTAALAGAFSGIAWPWAWARWGAAGAGSVELIVATLLLVALPAHACVLGFQRRQAPAPGQIDIALLQRIGAWVAAAALAYAASVLLRHA